MDVSHRILNSQVENCHLLWHHIQQFNLTGPTEQNCIKLHTLCPNVASSEAKTSTWNHKEKDNFKFSHYQEPLSPEHSTTVQAKKRSVWREARLGQPSETYIWQDIRNQQLTTENLERGNSESMPRNTNNVSQPKRRKDYLSVSQILLYISWNTVLHMASWLHQKAAWAQAESSTMITPCKKKAENIWTLSLPSSSNQSGCSCTSIKLERH